MKKVFLICLALGVLIALMGWSFELTLMLVFGWILFLIHTLPRMTVDWPSVFVGCLALVFFTAGVHAVGRAWRRGTPDGPRWKFRWSLATVAVVFLLFAAGISLVGIVHQTVWMLGSRDPFYVQTVQMHGGMNSPNNLKQIGIALATYENVYGTFPAGGTFNSEGEMLHSWETYSLSFLGYSGADIDYTFPWHHPHNERCFKCILPQFINESLPSPPVLDEQGFGLSHYAANSWVMGGNKKMRLQDITDGTSNTLLVGEVNAGFKPWGDPVNWRDPVRGINRSPQGFGGPPSAGGAYFSMADGSVRFVSERIDSKTLRAVSTPNGGETINMDN